MTKDEIIKLAREAGAEFYAETLCVNGKDAHDFIERFAAIVAAHEREACAKVCKDIANSQFESGETETAGVLDYCAAAIRARSEK